MKRGAECNTDHMMLLMKLHFGKKRFRGGVTRGGERKFDVSKLQGRCMDNKGRETTKGKYVREVSERMQDTWKSDSNVEEKWDVMKRAMCETAGSVLGSAGRHRADWFKESDQTSDREEK